MRHERPALRPTVALMLGLALVVLAAASALAQSWGEVRVVETPVNVRQTRSTQAPVVRALKPGERVKVDFVRPSGWGAIFEVDASERDEAKAMGFSDVRLMKPVAAVPSKTAAPAPARAAAPAAPVTPEVRQLSQVEARTEVFKERSLKSPVVAVLAPGERVQTGYPRYGFIAVFRMNDSTSSEAAAVGYVPEGMVKALPAPAAPAPARQAAAQAVSPAAAPAKATEFKAVAPAQVPAKAEAKSLPASEMKGEVKEGPALLGNQPTLSKQDPVRITSDKMVYNQVENSVMFQGNVHGTHTDMAIWAERITAYFTDKKKGKEQKQEPGGIGDFGDKIERIVADGNVRLVANKNEGACGQLTYFVQEGVIRMDNNPILREGQNTVRGDVIKFFIRENRSEVLSGTQRRVEAIFQSPKGEKK
ncbi:MAG: hypothetical protein KKA55_04030 [Proteobacteria bacterium]|nr:hypothetical protein [Pseudomonadota bacterium]MBU1594683.1 hypothetical protein [Pseudomonadota bacterium]